MPQSIGQLEQLSPGSQIPLPQKRHAPQSSWQLAHVSPVSQVPLPQ